MRARAAAAAWSILLAAFAVLPAERTPAVPGLQEAVTVDLAWPIAQNLSPNAVQYFQVPVHVNYQKAVAPHVCLAIIPAVTFYFDKPPIGYVLGFDPWIELEWHPNSPGLGGFFVGATAVFRTLFNISWGWALTSWCAGVGPVIGYQVLLPFNLLLNLTFAAVYGPGSAGPGLNYRLEVGIGPRF